MALEIGLDIRRDNGGFMRIALCIGVGLALLAGPALAQKTDRPEVKVGDRWQFVRYYSVASTKPNLTWADQFRYRNRNLGDRERGAIADDP